MKITEHSLREWLNIEISTDELVNQLVMAGFEVDAVTPVAPKFSGVVVGEVVTLQPHPNADRLRVCEVNVGTEVLTIVCGAANVYQGMRAPVALLDAELPNNLQIKKTKLRGIESYGMLCSAVELGLAETSNGLLELSVDAPIGCDIRDYLALNDNILDIKITANRGDCLSVTGIAREVAALNKCSWKKQLATTTVNKIAELFPVTVIAKEACPRYVCRIIKNVNNAVATPLWLREKLRRYGVQSINPVVDVANYVMFELGQPLHAFDLAKLREKIVVRYAEPDEEIVLLDGKIIKLQNDVLVIADADKALALAGIMGGQNSAVDVATTDILLESAYFAPHCIMDRARRYGLQTDASYRFERGVNPELQQLALDYLTDILCSIVGGDVAPAHMVAAAEFLPSAKTVELSSDKLKRILGCDIAAQDVVDILVRLDMQTTATASGWSVHVPSYRSDISIAEDLVEEIARIYGYAKILPQPIVSGIKPVALDLLQQQSHKSMAAAYLVAKGYCEAITYSFVDPQLQRYFAAESQQLLLANPVTSTMSVMRTNLWTGLVQAFLYNRDRKRSYVRLFEIGMCFARVEGETEPQQRQMVGGIACGSVYPENWQGASPEVDFFAVKNEVINLLRVLGCRQEVHFQPLQHQALHPRRCAAIYLEDVVVGAIGEIHPEVKQQLEIAVPVVLFELDLQALQDYSQFSFKAVSKFPFVQRDIAVIVRRDIAWERIKQKIVAEVGELLQDIKIFDIYCGQGIEIDEKSMAIRLVLQHDSRTLIDEEVDTLVGGVVTMLQRDFNAKLRG